MKKTFNLSRGRFGVIEYFDQTTFPNNEQYKYRESKDEKEKYVLLKTALPVKPRVNQIFFICESKQNAKREDFSEMVYSIDGYELFMLKEALSEIEKTYEGKTITLEESFIDN